jgi:lysophospholipase L1-like esterase
MPATATGRGAQVILDGDAQRAARGAYANTQLANMMYLDSLELSGIVADGETTPDGTTRTGAPAKDYLLGAASSSVTLNSLSRYAGIARASNPQTNAVMTTPPTVTDNAATLGSLTNVYTISTATKGVFNHYGGKPNDDGLGCYNYPVVTYSGSRVPFVSRVEIVADAAIVEFQVFNIGGTVRFIVNNQYVSKTVTTPVAGNFRFIRLDFTAAGGRARRNITIEMNKAVDFKGVAVGVTESVTKPAGRPIRMFVVGDSLAQGAGATSDFNCWTHVLADYLGVRDLWNGGLGGTGWIANSSGTQLTFRQRLSDMVVAAPDIVLIAGGLNDTNTTSTMTQITTEVTAYLSAIRASSGLGTVPIIMTYDKTSNILSTAQGVENAMLAAMNSFADPLMFFLPNATNVDGPMFTGTGFSGTPHNDGNCDFYIINDGIHPNDAGHAYMAGWLADNIIRRVLPL